MASRYRGGRLVVMNIGDTDVDHISDLRFRSEMVGELLPRLLELVTAH
jgi:hypothetical protein